MDWKLGRLILAALGLLCFYTPTAAGCESGYSVSEVLADGKILKLDDGSTWEVDAGDQATAASWQGVEIVVCDDKLIDTDDDETVEAHRLH